MAIAVRGTPTTFTTGVAVTTVTNTTVAGIQRGDWLIWVLAGNIITDPAVPAGGWTVVQSSTTTAIRLVTLRHLVDGSEGGSFAATVASARWVGVMAAYSGVDPSTPIDVTPPTATTGTTLPSWPNANQTPVTPGRWILGIGGAISTVGPSYTYVNGGAVPMDAIDVQMSNTAVSGTANAGAVIAHKEWTSGVFQPSMTVSQATTRVTGQTISLRPAFPSPHVGIINPASTRSATR